MLLTFDKTKKKHYIYQEIYNEIKDAILEGKLKANEKLPSKRNLASQLKIGINTVTTAYEQLLAEGYIYTRQRKGYFVESITKFAHRSKTDQVLPNDLKESTHKKEGWLSLSHMTADVSLFPFSKWIKCEQKVIEKHRQELSEIVHPQGPYILRETICRMIALSRGVVCEPEQIVIGAGTQLLIQELMGFQPAETSVAVENPGYSRFYTLLKRMGFEVETVDVDQEGANVAALKAKDTNFLFVTPSHQFPTGKIMPISRRIELLNWSTQQPNRYIVEDDYDSEFKYETDSIPSLQSLDGNQRVIYTGTFSKTILPGLRISYMVLPVEMLRKYREYNFDLMQNSNILALYTLHYFIESGEYARHLKRMNHHYEKKRKLLIREIKHRFGDRVVIEDIPAGLHFFAKFYTETTYELIEEKAKKEKLEIYSIRRFELNKRKREERTIELTLGFATIGEDQISEAVDRLYRIL
ncbi:PLP-dependent aminotransferase family protein [Virgibacillus halodenitrificans]|uniref:MocR-like transcriptional regulator GabR n=1 Tax=Virgibacillus halodenitrificans TaxID=1482 RepID=UPI0024BF88E7|nr:PLP-dependent aminotransferase family protein [Virgibacillus halodenitrificans]WHX26212.1 PLP-dependent aminotransferase family protein [Virgibacillus halodenitrificans]